MACFVFLTGKDESMEAWPTSPVLSEEKNAREKEKAHRYYERQLKACSWYSKIPRHSWIEVVVEPFDSSDACLQCCYEEACGCVLVTNQSPVYDRGSQRRATVESGRSSFGDALRVESRTSTEDEKSFYDNLCEFCKFTSLERRARKYGEWRRRWSVKVAEMREDEPRRCTCAMDNLSFIEWKQLFERDEQVTLSQVNQKPTDFLSTSDYGTQKSKDSETTVACREYPVCLTFKTPSLGYNSSCSIPSTERELDTTSCYSPSDTSNSEGSSDEVNSSTLDSRLLRSNTSDRLTSSQGSARIPHAFHGFRGNRERFTEDDDVLGDKLIRILRSDQEHEHIEKFKRKKKKVKDRPSNYEGGKRLSHKTRSNLKKQSGLLGEKGATSSDYYKGRTSYSERSTLCSESETSCFESDGSQFQGASSMRVTATDVEALPKLPTENDETFPPDLLSEFLVVAKNIDEFYESIHAKKFREKRLAGTSRESVDDTTEDRVHFSLELKKRIRSLERLCSFVDYSDEETFGKDGLSSLDKDDQSVWKLSQQSINLTLSRRSRSNPSSGSSPSSSRCSTSGSGSSNSRCSIRQSNCGNGKASVASTGNICSPDSGFSEKASLFSAKDSPDANQLGTKWAGSMQWDYTDWFIYTYDCNSDKRDVEEQGLTTIQEAPTQVPQDPLDWDW